MKKLCPREKQNLLKPASRTVHQGYSSEGRGKLQNLPKSHPSKQFAPGVDFSIDGASVYRPKLNFLARISSVKVVRKSHEKGAQLFLRHLWTVKVTFLVKKLGAMALNNL